MALRKFMLLVLASFAYAAPDKLTHSAKQENGQLQKINDENEDLKTASSSYSHQYSNWRGPNPGGYEFSVTGFGTIDDKYGSNFRGASGHDNQVGFNRDSAYGGYNAGYDGVNGAIGRRSGYVGNAGYGGVAGYDGNIGYGGNTGYAGSTGYGGNVGYGGDAGYAGNTGYGGNVGNGGNTGYNGNAGYGGNGGYGGYGGDGGLTSYYGYNNPYYQGSNHLGYGYYNKKPGYGNIYNSGITPSLVTGYRGYSR